VTSRCFLAVTVQVRPNHCAISCPAEWRWCVKWRWWGACSEMESEFEVIVHQSELEVTRGSDATLRCRASGNVADVDRILWQRENAELPAGVYSYALVFYLFVCLLSGSVTTESSTNTYAEPLTNQTLNLILTLILILTLTLLLNSSSTSTQYCTEHSTKYNHM